uniref:Uncharacterized protein n=1 Tax=viral metagenome TaxID=1070528 RepID=A0A6H2A582_9ZZZZ
MKVTIGKEGCKKTWQAEFPETTDCVLCKGKARIGFVAHEGMEKSDKRPFVSELHLNKGKRGELWLHDCCAVAVYFCGECLKPTALYNQG